MKTDVHLDTIELTVAFCTLRFAIKSIALGSFIMAFVVYSTTEFQRTLQNFFL